MINHIHHVAILTSDIEPAIDHYVELLGCERKTPVKPGLHWLSVLLPIGNGMTALQLIQPLEGPGVEELKKNGEGTLFEIGFKCSDAEVFSDHLKNRNMTPADLSETPIESKCMVSKFGNRFFIVPRDKSRGTRLEFVEFGGS